MARTGSKSRNTSGGPDRRIQNNNNYYRPRLSIPVADESVVEWAKLQYNLSDSVRIAIREYIKKNGYTDATCAPVIQEAKKGRPSNYELQHGSFDTAIHQSTDTSFDIDEQNDDQDDQQDFTQSLTQSVSDDVRVDEDSDVSDDHVSEDSSSDDDDDFEDVQALKPVEASKSKKTQPKPSMNIMDQL